MAKERVKVSPEVCTYASEDGKNLILEIELPGVRKEDILLKMMDGSFSLGAPRDDIEFSVSLTLGCPVKAAEATAKFENGLLTIEAPFNDFNENAVLVKVA